MDYTDRRLIEETFPIKEVSIESAKEKNIRQGHISTLHIWWARRPLAASRATAYAALVPPSDDAQELEKQRKFIIDLCKWENSNNEGLLQKARADILKANGGVLPKVLDPFSGGGSIPLEALRLGCETYANDYNPVAVLIEKCTLEYPQKYGRPSDAKKEILTGTQKNPLLDAVKKWGDWLLEETKAEIGRFYPEDPDGSVPVGYIWARTIPCQNPACGEEIPLMRQYWLANKFNKKISLYPCAQEEKVQFMVVGDSYAPIPEDFDPTNGTVDQAIVTCIVCGNSIEAKNTRRLFQEGKSNEKMVAVVLTKPGEKGKRYRIATPQDIVVFQEAAKYLKEKIPLLREEWGMEPVPDEYIHTPDGKEYRPGGLLYNFTPILLYGMTTWGSLFNSRQKLALVTLCENIRRVYREMINKGYDEELSRSVVGYLGLTLDMSAAFCNSLARWENTSQLIKHLYGRQALPMLWDYAEVNVFSKSSGSFEMGLKYYNAVVTHCSNYNNFSKSLHSSATSLPLPDNYLDAVFTDPPYYDNVPYSDLSDFFYVWLKRSVGDLYPELFSTSLTPKTNEAIAELPLLRGMKKNRAKDILEKIKTKEHFEQVLSDSFKEMHRVLKPNGIAVIVYAHKSTEGWETLINSLLDSSLVITAALPINTEMQARLRARESAALASSIYLVARKWEREPTGFYKEVKEELEQHLNMKLDKLWKEGISGADFFISAIGSAIEVYGKYTQVMDYEGNIIRADRLLQDVEDIATNYSVKKILKNGFSDTISDLTRFYVIYRWYYGSTSIPFDEARKLATSCGLDLSVEWAKNGSFIKKQKENLAVLDPKEREKHLDDLKESPEIIDVLHAVLLLWEKSKQQEILDLLRDSGFGRKDMFFMVAQAISETLPNENKEKKLLDGFLAGRNRIQEDMRKDMGQQNISEILPAEAKEKKLLDDSIPVKKKMQKKMRKDTEQRKLFE